MRLIRALRMWRWTPLAAVMAAAACEHGDINQIIAVDGDTVIINISMSTQFAGGTPAGTRTLNRYLFAGFDSTVSDAFSRSSTNPADFRRSPAPGCGFLGATPLIYPTATTAATYSPPNRYLPALFGSGRIGDVSGCGQYVAWILPGGHPGNGSGNTVWEFWFEPTGLAPATRHVMGVARYALQVRGALDIAEILLTGTVTQPDSLVFRAGDFNPGGRKAAARFTTNCASVNIVRPVATANPHLLGSGLTDALGAVSLDQTACSNAASAWFNGVGNANSPTPANNNTPLGSRQYNFLVIWEALADSTPNYARPVYRQQIGPLPTTAGVIINNAYGPVPAVAFTQAQLLAAIGGIGRPDSVTVTMTGLVALANASYQVWFTKTGTDTAALATGRFDRLVNNVVRDSNLSTNSFNPGPSDTVGSVYRMRIDYATFDAQAGFDAVILAVAPAGGTTRPGSQPMWAGISRKLSGQAAPPLAGNLSFGNFDNGGTARAVWAPAGIGTGGVFGRLLDVQVTHLLRPPVGFVYNAYLRKAGTDTILAVGPLTGPFPDYASLVDADVSLGGSVNAIEIVQAVLRYQATSDTELCLYNRIDVRLEPKAKTGGVVGRTISVTGDNPAPTRQARCR